MKDQKIYFGQVDGHDYIDFAAVGVTFENRQQILQELFQTSMSNKDVVIPIYLQKQETNEYDKNAVKICLKDNRCIGFVSKNFNEDVGKLIPQIKRSYIKQIYMNNKRLYNAMIRLEF